MITDEMIAEAAAELNEAMIKSVPDPHECKHQFSKKFERKMNKLIFRVNHPIRYKAANRVASIILIVFLGLAVAISCSPTARAAVIGWVKKAYESFYSYYFDGETELETNEKYQISPLPEGYVEISNTEDGGTHMYVYGNKQNELLVFSYSISPDSASFFVKNDGYIVEETLVLGKTADLYLSKDGNMANGIIWWDDEAELIFYISGQFGGDELKKP